MCCVLILLIEITLNVGRLIVLVSTVNVTYIDNNITCRDEERLILLVKILTVFVVMLLLVTEITLPVEMKRDESYLSRY